MTNSSNMINGKKFKQSRKKATGLWDPILFLSAPAAGPPAWSLWSGTWSGTRCHPCLKNAKTQFIEPISHLFLV